MEAYRDLIESLADLLPTGPSQLPALTHRDLAVILLHEPALLTEAISDDESTRIVARALDQSPLDPLAAIGARLVAELTAHARNFVWLDVARVIDERDERGADDKLENERSTMASFVRDHIAEHERKLRSEYDDGPALTDGERVAAAFREP